MKNIEGEIWYPYTFDLGRDVTGFENVINKVLDLDFVLAGFESSGETFAYKENGSLIGSKFVSSEFSPENKFVFNNRPKDELKEQAIHFLGLQRLSEIHHFSANYRRLFHYLHFALAPIVFKVNLGKEDEFLLLLPSLKITTTGVLTVTFRLNFAGRSLEDVIKLENLYSLSLSGLAIPSELVEINQHIAALYNGVKIHSEVQKFYLDQIKPFEVYQGINLCSMSAEGMRFEHIAENYKYLLIEKLFLHRKLKPKDFQRIDRTGYWQCRPSVHVFKYDEQEKRASEILSKRKEAVVKLFNRVDVSVEHSQLQELKNLRIFDDYLLFVNKGLTLQVYGYERIKEIEDQYQGNQLQMAKLWLNLGTRVIMDYVDNRFMNLKIWHQLIHYDNALSQKSLIKKMEDKQEQEFIFEMDYVPAGELQELINVTKAELQFDKIEEQIKKRSDLLALKANVVRSNRVFWYGLLISVSFGLANLEKLSSLYFEPLFKLWKWCFGIEHSMLFSAVIFLATIGVFAVVIKRLTRF
jgi:hypothetical protein